nr:tripartite tricarboxylate transporter substrate binding protein [uncultured Roseateles sp.]
MKRNTFVRVLAALVSAGAASFLPSTVTAAPYPDKPLRIVVPYAPGGAGDILARVLAEKLAPRLGQSVIVDNKTGAAGNIGIDAVAKAPPDGYTISFALSSNLMINQFLFKKLPYDPQKDLTLVAKVADAPLVLVVNASLRIDEVADLRRYMGSNKGRLSYGSWGVGTIAHLSASRVNDMVGGDMSHVPYRGEAPMLQDLVGGTLAMSYATGAQATQFITDGRLKAIGVTGTTRLPSLPRVPTLAEAGLDDPLLKAVGWIGFAAPAATPKPVVQRLASELEAVLRLPEVQQRIRDVGWVPSYQGSADFTATYRREAPIWEAVVRKSGATLD